MVGRWRGRGGLLEYFSVCMAVGELTCFLVVVLVVVFGGVELGCGGDFGFYFVAFGF